MALRSVDGDGQVRPEPTGVGPEASHHRHEADGLAELALLEGRAAAPAARAAAAVRVARRNGHDDHTRGHVT